LADTGYAVGGSGTAIGASGSEDKQSYWSLRKLKRAYLDYLGTKREEIDEQKDARRFVHGSQWTAAEIQQLELRKQPLVWNNKTKRKINGIIGTLRRIKQDPKAFPRTPSHDQGAELATAALRYALERTEWERKDPIAAEMCAIDGIGGVEFNLEQGDKDDTEVGCDVVYIDSFFYDPRSVADDFSDANYLGVAKWFALERALEMFPNYKEEIEASVESGSELTTDSDRENRFFQSEGDDKRVRIVECWYKHAGKWCWSLFTGSHVLDEGESPFVDEDGKSEHKYEMFCAYIDQDADRYGFVRDLKPLQREINMRRSKALAVGLARRIVAPVGAFDDIEVARREAARHDGVVIYNPQGSENAPQFDDQARGMEVQAQMEFLADVKQDFESFGPTNALSSGEGLDNSSGRAIHLLQQAGLAELGPFMLSYRGWKIRVYRKMWNSIQRHWTGERWIRVTDDQDLKQFIQINGISVDPMTGQPTLVNAIGELDVDIILDEGPDTVNMEADAYDTLTLFARNVGGMPPEKLPGFIDMMIELAPLPHSKKKKLLEMWNPEPTPEMQMQKQLQMRGAVAEVAEVETSAELNKAKTFETIQNAMNPEGGEGGEGAAIQAMQKQQEAEMDMSLEAVKHRDQMELKRQELQMKREEAELTRQLQREDKEREFQMKREESERDRQFKMEDSERNRAMKMEDSERNRKAEANGSKAKAAVEVKHSADQIAGPIADVIENNNTVMQQLMQSILQMQQEERAEHRAFMDVLTKKLTAPKRIVRDKTGRAAGVETMGE
jgi:hypothetical protein